VFCTIAQAQRDQQASDRHHPADVEQSAHRPSDAEADVRIAAQRDGANRQQDSQFGRADAANDMRNTPRTAVARNTSPDTSRYATSSDSAITGVMNPEHASPVSSNVMPTMSTDVIDVETVARPLDVADACQRAVEAVRQPVDASAATTTQSQLYPNAPTRSRGRPAPWRQRKQRQMVRVESTAGKCAGIRMRSRFSIAASRAAVFTHMLDMRSPSAV
jgi:hypothetical protein